MKKVTLKIKENKKIAAGIWKMVLAGDISAIKKPGQFINIKLDGFYLRRPISVCDINRSEENDRCFDNTDANSSVTIIYKIFGGGTECMTSLPVGKELDVLTGLGNGYDLSVCGTAPLLVGGGVGIPPLYLTAKRLISAGKKVKVILGFTSSEDAYYIEEFESLGCEVIVATEDGSIGIKGRVTDALSNITYSYFYTCGPIAMLKAVYDKTDTDGQFSFEERMGCGFGACMGCTCKTKHGYKRICKEGPVLSREEIIW